MDSVLKTGEDWPYHYRGTTYHFNKKGEAWWQSSKDGLKVNIIAGQKAILEDFHILDVLWTREGSGMRTKAEISKYTPSMKS